MSTQSGLMAQQQAVPCVSLTSLSTQISRQVGKSSLLLLQSRYLLLHHTYPEYIGTCSLCCSYSLFIVRDYLLESVELGTYLLLIRTAACCLLPTTYLPTATSTYWILDIQYLSNIPIHLHSKQQQSTQVHMDMSTAAVGRYLLTQSIVYLLNF